MWVLLGLLPRLSFAQLTYNGDVKRLLQAKCMYCHSSYGVAPFSMETYASTLPWADSMRSRVYNKKMPPWNAAHDQQFPDPERKFTNDRSLTPEQIDLIVNWVNQGAYEGDPADAPPNPPAPPSTWGIGTPDIILSMQAPFQVAEGDGGDIQRVFRVLNPTPVDIVISGLEIRPSNLRIAHHMVALLDDNGSAASEEATYGSSALGWNFYDYIDYTDLPIAIWSSRGDAQAYSEDRVLRIPAGMEMTIQIHYYDDLLSEGEVQFDQTEIGLKIAQNPAAQEVFVQAPTWTDFEIPPNVEEEVITRSFNIIEDVHIWAVYPHMHHNAMTSEIFATLPDSSTVRLLYIDRWNFDWHNFYVYNKGLAIPAGSEISMTSTFFNFNDVPVPGGDGSFDEMMAVGYAWTNDVEGISSPVLDLTPPKILSLDWNGATGELEIVFSEVVEQPRYPYDVKIAGAGGAISPIITNFSGTTLELTFNPVELIQPFSGLVLGYFGIKDLAGNYLDVNGNGIGGEFADRLVFADPNNSSTNWEYYE